MYWLLHFIPKNYLSLLVGKVVRFRKPLWFSKNLTSWFVRQYQVDLKDAEFPIENYACLGDLFRRSLKEGARPIANSDIVSPVDGKVVEHGIVKHDSILQVKGKSYSVFSLLKDKKLAEFFLDGYFVTIYLAPPDYHQIHSPVSGEITDCIYIQGNLWPVNDWSVKNIDQLFAINERIATIINTENLGKVAVVKVGATNVGAIRICYDNICANQAPQLFGKQDEVRKINYQNPISISKGDKLGVFEMGSTVILLFEKGEFSIPEGKNNFKLRVGEALAF